jgi:ribosomal protein L20
MAFLQQAAAARAAAQGQSLFPTNPALAPVNPYTPVTTNPYASGVTNPYNNPATTTSPYGQSYTNPYSSYVDAGSVLQGAADIMRAYGTVITSQEQARMIREQAIQAKLENKKKKFDLDFYIKNNTPTFTEEQTKLAKTTRKRIQTMSGDPEIINGKSLNLLLDDLRKHVGKKTSIEPFALSEDLLGQVNVTKSIASLGILRNGGEFVWPTVFEENFPAKQLRLIENQSKTLVKNAEQGKLDVNALKDMRNEINKLRELLVKKVNEVSTTQYLEGKRFLNAFDEARLSLDRGEALTQVSFQKWINGGKTLQQLVDYMVANGLRFTTATQGDEAAYRAVYTGMAQLDIALNTMFGSSGPTESTEPKDAP